MSVNESAGRRLSSLVARLVLRACALAALPLTIGMPRPVAAQWETNRATARNLAAEGSAALRMNDYAIAEDRFRRADTLVHAPTIVVDHARALMGLGLFVEAQERLELVLREGVADDAPHVWKRALVQARGLVGEVRNKVGWLTINVNGPLELQVSVDDTHVPAAALKVRRATNPGSHRITATALGYLPAEVVTSIHEGGERAISLNLEREPRPRQQPKKPKQKPTRKQASQLEVVRKSGHPRVQSSNTLGYIALGVGGVSLGVGAVAGAVFLSKHSQLASRCPDASNCEEKRLIDEYNRYGTASAVGLGVGLIACTTGIWLVLSRKSDEKSPAPASFATVTPYVSIARLGLEGRF